MNSDSLPLGTTFRTIHILQQAENSGISGNPDFLSNSNARIWLFNDNKQARKWFSNNRRNKFIITQAPKALPVLRVTTKTLAPTIRIINSNNNYNNNKNRGQPRHRVIARVIEATIEVAENRRVAAVAAGLRCR